MSLINDALKRANTNPKPAAFATTTAEPAMVPVAAAVYTSSAARPRAKTPVGLLVAMVAMAGVAGWFFLKWREASNGQPAIQAAASVPPVAAPAKPPETQAAKVQAPPAVQPPPATTVAATQFATPPAPKPAPQASAVSPRPETPAPTAPAQKPTSEPVAASAPAAAHAPATVQPQPIPELKLQAIVFRMKNPSALINGHHVEVGDEVGGARVVEIQRTTVFVEWQGKRQPLQIK